MFEGKIQTSYVGAADCLFCMKNQGYLRFMDFSRFEIRMKWREKLAKEMSSEQMTGRLGHGHVLLPPQFSLIQLIDSQTDGQAKEEAYLISLRSI